MATSGPPVPPQAPFGSDALPQPSPERQRQQEISIDQGVKDRLASTRNVGPSVRQATQSEVLNMSMLVGQLGNPFSVRRIPFSVMRDMTTDPMIAFALYYIRTPLIRSDWYLKCQVAKLGAAVDAALRPILSDVFMKFSGSLSYGYQPIVKRFKLGKLDGVYRDPQGEDPEKDLPVWDSENVDALLWDEPIACAPEHCIPRWNDDGSFNGFTFLQIPLPNPVLAGIANIYGEDVPGNYVPAEFATWVVNEQDQEFGSVYGSPRTKRAYRYFWSYWFRWALADRAYENRADPPKKVYFPTDQNEAVDVDDPDPENPTAKSLRQVALEFGEQARSGATLAIPGDFVVDESTGKPTSSRKWDISYLTGGDEFQHLDDTFTALDKLKIRCVTADTPVDCPRDHRRFPLGVPISMLKPGDPVWTFNVEERRFELRPVKDVGITQRDQQVFKVRLSNGLSFRATADHPVLTVDPCWKDVGELVEGDQLVEFQRDFEPYVKLDPASYGGCRIKEYHKVAEWMGIRDESQKKNKVHAHHIDGAHANNARENLQGLTNSEHMSLERTGRHMSTASRLLVSEGHLKHHEDVIEARCEELNRADDILLQERRVLIVGSACEVDGCGRKMLARGLCSMHYQRALRDNEFDPQAHDPETWRQRDAVYKLKECTNCGREYAVTGSRQKQCQACRYLSQIKANRMPTAPPPSFDEICDAITVVSVEPDDIEDVWDVSIDAPMHSMNFVSCGVVLHNSMFIPEQAFIESQRGSSTRLMVGQLGEVYAQSQQSIADNFDSYINKYWIPQFIAANFPELAGTPCRKVSRGFGQQDAELIKQIVQLVGQVKGNVLPVDIRELLRQQGMPLMTEAQMERQQQEIIESQAKAQPPAVPPEKTGMQGYNAGIEKTPQGTRYYEPPQSISFAEHSPFIDSLPDTPHFRDVASRSAALRLRKLFQRRYDEVVSAFAKHVSDQSVLRLAQEDTSTDPQRQQAEQGMTVANATTAAAALMAAFGTAVATKQIAGSLRRILASVVRTSGAQELRLAHLDSSVFDVGMTDRWVDARVQRTLESVDQTVRKEFEDFLRSELQRTADPKVLAQAVEEHFADLPRTHAERVAREEIKVGYNHGALSAFKDAGVAQVQAHDASDGQDRDTDRACIERNGTVYSVEAAMTEQDHPNGTLYFRPLLSENFSVERMDEFPERLEVADDVLAAWDDETETLYVKNLATSEQERAYALATGARLTIA